MLKELAIVFVGLFIAGCAGTPPSHLGLKNERFAPCPDTPNCVNSQSSDADHHIEPLRYKGSREAAVEKLKDVIRSMERTRIIEATGRYMRVEFTSAIMRFVDDVEFCFPDDPVVHVKSASRTGYSDFGVNRRRVETIRKQFE